MKRKGMRIAAAFLLAGLLFSAGCFGKEPASEKEPEAESVAASPAEAENTENTENRENRTENIGEAADSGDRAEVISKLLDQWDFEQEKIFLPQVQEELDRRGIPYTGSLNVSGERLDLWLEDGSRLLFLTATDLEGNPWGYELIMKGEQFNRNGFAEDYLNQYDVTVDERYYPDLTEAMSETEDLYLYDQTRLSIARNQIFAVHGRCFSDPFLQKVFEQKNWYEPTLSAEEFSAAQNELLTEIQKKNLDAVLDAEINLHYRTGGAGSVALCLLSGSRVDLDGDGRGEQILFERRMEDDDLGQVWLDVRTEDGEGDASLTREEINPRGHCYLADDPASDFGGKLLIVAADGPSDDYTMAFYRWEEGCLRELGMIGSYPESLRVDGNTLKAMVECRHFQCQPLELEYRLTERGIQWEEKTYYEYKHSRAAVVTPVTLFAGKDGAAGITLVPGDEIRVLGGDLAEWVELEKVSTGERGWLRSVGCDCTQPDGTTGMSGEWFEGLPFYD